MSDNTLYERIKDSTYWYEIKYYYNKKFYIFCIDEKIYTYSFIGIQFNEYNEEVELWDVWDFDIDYLDNFKFKEENLNVNMFETVNINITDLKAEDDFNGLLYKDLSETIFVYQNNLYTVDNFGKFSEFDFCKIYSPKEFDEPERWHWDSYVENIRLDEETIDKFLVSKFVTLPK